MISYLHLTTQLSLSCPGWQIEVNQISVISKMMDFTKLNSLIQVVDVYLKTKVDQGLNLEVHHIKQKQDLIPDH